jgi:hypothetical protein
MANRVEAARSILARPGQVALEVDGRAIDLEQLTLTDQDGTPRLTCELGGDLARGAERKAGAMLRLDTRPEDRDPDGRPVDRTLTLAGALALRGVVACDCCQQARHVVVLDADFVLLTTWSRVGGRRFVVGRPERVDATEFRSAEHALNAGYLRSAAEHATDCHQEELRHALASRTRTAPQDVIAVHLEALTPRSVELVWVDRAGAHSTTLTFPRRVRDPRELAATLRSRLGVGAC